MDPGAPLRLLDEVGNIAYDDFSQARLKCPVIRTESGGWYIARYDDVAAGVRAIETFASSFRDPGVIVPDEEQLLFEIPEPRHGQLRRLVNASIAAHKVARLEPFIRTLCESLLSAFLEEPNGDFLDQVIAPVSTRVISKLIGVPEEDHHQFKVWSDEVVAGPYVTQNRSDRGEGLAGGYPEFADYLDRRITECRTAGEPPDSLLTRMAHARIDGQSMSDVEIRTQAFFLVIAGNETTRNAIGNLVQTLALSPSLYQQVRTDRALIPGAVEESLRHDSPTTLLMRDCLEDTTIGGTPIAKGEKVIFGVASANRDASYFDDGDEFILGRENARQHLAFGNGPHICPGAALARLEAITFVGVLCDMVTDLSLPSGFVPIKAPIFWSNGPHGLPVQLTAAGANH
jgi:cytochrome P450